MIDPIRFARAAQLALGLLLSLSASQAAVAADVPFLSGRVVDHAEILKPATRERVSAALKSHEDASGDQIAVLTVPTLDGASVEEYAVKVFDAWKLGKKGKDNGVLVLVVPNDHKMRIEVGYGLEGTLTDVAASRIIRNVMTPAFKSGDYDKGVEDGAAAVVATLEGKAGAAADPPASSTNATGLANAGADMPWTMRLLLGVFVFSIIGLFTFVGVMTPGVGWFLYVFLIPFWAMFPLFIIGGKPTVVLLAVYLIGYPVTKLILSRQPWYQKAAADLKKTGRASVGGFVLSNSTGSSGWSSGGGSSDSGGFSGDGGSSGGGGASGSW